MLDLIYRRQLYLYRHPTDMRKSFDGLSGLVLNELGREMLDTEAYLFINRRRDRLKILAWQDSGFELYYKRLEQGTFELPKIEDQAISLKISWSELVMILEGIELRSVVRRRRYKGLKTRA